MIHPAAAAFATAVILASLFALTYLAFYLYTRSEERRLQLEHNRYHPSVEVRASAYYSLRFRPGVNSDTPASAYLVACNPLPAPRCLHPLPAPLCWQGSKFCRIPKFRLYSLHVHFFILNIFCRN